MNLIWAGTVDLTCLHIIHTGLLPKNPGNHCICKMRGNRLRNYYDTLIVRNFPAQSTQAISVFAPNRGTAWNKQTVPAYVQWRCQGGGGGHVPPKQMICPWALCAPKNVSNCLKKITLPRLNSRAKVTLNKKMTGNTVCANSFLLDLNNCFNLR